MMIKDKILRLIFVPCLAIGIPFGAGIITYHKYNPFELGGIFLYFILVSFTLWSGCIWSHERVRSMHGVNANPMVKIMSIYALSFFLTCLGGVAWCLVWMEISREIFSWVPIFKFCFISVLAVLLFTPVYEVMYLSKEREIDNKIVDQLDNELTHAELAALRNELDPHFIFNSLNTLSHLIASDHVKAQEFNKNIAEVYKYFLVNKNKDFVEVGEEIEFINKYFFLLRIRHDDKLQLTVNVDPALVNTLLIVPCALQILVENAIKHNQFTNESPLHIVINIDNRNINISNRMLFREAGNNSTRVGLRNLNSQYLLLSNKKIEIEKSQNKFIVKLPMIKSKNKGYDKSYNN